MATNGSSNGPVEKKVTTTTATALIVTAIMAYLMKEVPWLTQFSTVVEVVISALVVAAVTFIVGFWTKHTARNDVGTRRTGTSDNINPTG